MDYAPRCSHISCSFCFWIVFAACLVLLQTPGQDADNPALATRAQDLVVVQGDHFVEFKSARFLKVPYTVLYFGAGWCPDCRRFSPALVAAYDRQSPTDRRFEVIFISKDKSEESMLKFMRSEKMKWPALAFNKITSATHLTRLYSGHGIPCLTVIDQTGAQVLQSKSDQDATEVLDQLLRLIRDNQSTGR